MAKINAWPKTIVILATRGQNVFIVPMAVSHCILAGGMILATYSGPAAQFCPSISGALKNADKSRVARMGQAYPKLKHAYPKSKYE